jgi:class 3 adenylate cyclase
MRCAACQHENLAAARTCSACGGALGKRCAACGALGSETARFCAECGAPLGEPARAAAAEGERRQITVVFCDLVGSTPLAHRLDPEDYQALLRDYQFVVRSAVTRFGGYVAHYLGDGAVVYFGWPRAHGDDAERAVRAALAVQEGIAELNGRLPARSQLAVRIGIHTGLVVVGEIGVGVRDVIALGDVPNVAARVQGEAEPGSVLVTDAVHQLVAGLFVVEEHGTPALKGVARPITLYRVRQSSGVRGRLDAARSLIPLVGRVAERARLRELWEHALRGEGRAVLVVAEPGVGKSRLVRTLKDEIGGDHRWVETGGSSYFQSTPFHPIVALLRQLLGLRDELDANERLALLERSLAASGLSAAGSLPYVTPLFDLTLPEGFELPLGTVDAQRRKVLATLADWIAGLARLQPTVLVVEDLHWVDPSTLELLTILLEHAPALPLLLVYTARPEFRVPWSDARCARLALERLDPELAREVIAACGGAGLPRAAVDALVARADGVPLFLEELTRLVVSTGGDPVVATGEIPMALHDLLMARLDRLPRARELAQVASVLGREFSHALWRAVADRPDAELERGLADLLDAGLLHRGGAADDTYVFKHALIRDAAYASLLKRRRRDLHRATARALTERFPDVATTQPELVAHHLGVAGDADAATTAWERAAERALARSALVEAAHHYGAALAAVRTLPDDAARTRRELLLQVAEGQVLFATRGFGSAEVEQAFARAADLGARLGGNAHLGVLIGLQASANVRGQIGAALRLAREIQDLGKRDGRTSTRMWGHVVAGHALYHRGDVDEARTELVAGLPLYDDAHPPSAAFDLAVTTLTYLSYVEWHRGRPALAHRHMAEALARAHRRDTALNLAWAAIYELGLYGLLREPKPLLERVDRVLRLARDQPIFEAIVTALGGWATAKLGRHDEGVTALRRGIEMYRAAGSRLQVSLYMTLLFECLADATLDERGALAADILEAVGEEELELPEALRVRAEVLMGERAPVAQVESTLREAVGTAKRHGSRWYELRAATSLAAYLRTHERSAEGHALLAPLCASFDDGLETYDFRTAAGLLAELRA